jgi:hypothetical protein
MEEYYVVSGHGTSNIMKFLMHGKYKYYEMFKDIDRHVNKCKICALAGNELVNTRNDVIKSICESDLWEVDLIGPIKGS